MLSSVLLLAAAFQVGPFYEQRSDFAAFRPFWSCEGETTDLLWPIFTSHRDWWRFCWFVHYQENRKGGFQFETLPLWINGRESADAPAYWMFFPLWGEHPHFLLMHDFSFCLWPVWMRYRMPRPSQQKWMTMTAVLFPFVHWRDDGSWGVWPLYGLNHRRESDHRYVLWPLVTWANYRADRDTAGAGSSWMAWPFCGFVDRERESQWMVLPPFVSHVKTPDGWRGRYPYPFVEIERRRERHRTSIFPFYENVVNYRFYDGAESEAITRFGWRLVEILPDETRVFPFWTSRGDGTYFRLWPLWGSRTAADGSVSSRFLSLFPIRWADSVDRNWAKFWTFYEREWNPVCTTHSLLWGLIGWRTVNE